MIQRGPLTGKQPLFKGKQADMTNYQSGATLTITVIRASVVARA